MATLAATSGSRTRGRCFGAASGSSGCSVPERSGLLRLPTRANIYTESPSMGKQRFDLRGQFADVPLLMELCRHRGVLLENPPDVSAPRSEVVEAAQQDHFREENEEDNHCVGDPV